MDHNKTSKEVTPVAPAQPPPAQVLAQVLAQPLAQPPPAQSWARASAAPPADKSRWRDVFVYATIALVAVAVGVGLNLHLDVEAWLAAAVAAPTALALLQAHQLQASGRQIDGLRRDLADLRRMTAQTMRVQREAMPAAGQRIAGNGMANGGSAIVHATATNAAGPGPGLQPRSQQAQPQRPQARGAPIGPAATAQTMPAHSIQPPAPRQAPLQPPQQTPGGGAAVSAATGHAAVAPDGGKNALPPPLPPSPATPVALTPAALTTSPRAASSPVPSPVSVESSAATTPTSPVAIPIDTTQDGVLQVAAPQIASRVSEALMGTYWGHRPGVSQETAAPAASHPASAATGLSLGSAPAVASPGSASPGTSARAVSLVPDLAEGPGERELETMQNLIQQLAQQLNAPRGDSIPATPPVPAASALDLAQSVAALRSTATTMRHEADLMAEKPGIGALPPVNPRLAAALRTDARATADGDAEIKQAKEPKADPAADVLHPETGPERGSEPGTSASRSLSKAVLASVSPVPDPIPASPYAEIARVAEAVAADRIDVFLDPILALADRKARLFEVSVRLRSSDGDVLDPGSIRSVASGTGLLARIDAAKLSRSARVAARLQARGTDASLYSNLASESLSDDVFLDTFEDAIAEQEDLPKRLVLSFNQADVRAFNTVHWETVAAMSEIGLRFALEDVTDLDMDFERLKDTGFEFIKLDARMFLEGLPAAGGPIPASDLCRHLADQGFTLIVGRIEDETSHAKLMGFGVLFGQGTFFGGARQVQVDPPAVQHVAAA